MARFGKSELERFIFALTKPPSLMHGFILRCVTALCNCGLRRFNEQLGCLLLTKSSYIGNPKVHTASMYRPRRRSARVLVNLKGL